MASRLWEDVIPGHRRKNRMQEFDSATIKATIFTHCKQPTFVVFPDRLLAIIENDRFQLHVAQIFIVAACMSTALSCGTRRWPFASIAPNRPARRKHVRLIKATKRNWKWRWPSFHQIADHFSADQQLNTNLTNQSRTFTESKVVQQDMWSLIESISWHNTFNLTSQTNQTRSFRVHKVTYSRDWLNENEYLGMISDLIKCMKFNLIGQFWLWKLKICRLINLSYG